MLGVVSDLHDALLSRRPRFVSFVRSRVLDRTAAEDIVQLAYARTIERGGMPEDPDSAVRWFYRVLSNAATDYLRRSGAEQRGLERLQREPAVTSPAAPARLCRCVNRALGELKPHYRQVISRVEVEGASLAVVAAEAGISSNNAAVRLHRARRLLADRLRRICGSCSLDACADCDCGAMG
jgi:RNA polymerase sigma factor (sigma-70 family)